MKRIVLSLPDIVSVAAPLFVLVLSLVVVAQSSYQPATTAYQLAPAAAPAAQITPVNLSPPILQQAWPQPYTVRKGDSLSAIAQKMYGDQRKWTNIFWANKTAIHWASLILVGQHLSIPEPAAPRPAPARLDPSPAPNLTPVGGDGSSSPAHAQFAATVNPNSYSGFQACVISRESGGNSQVMNSSGHYGLYQFSASTWQAYGGSAADFGHASVAEQNQVFATAMAQGGQSNWSPYDGC